MINNKTMPLFGLLCAAGWALAYPFIKMGYSELAIASDDLGGKLLFAGIRFAAAGLLLLIIYLSDRRKNIAEKISFGVKDYMFVMLFALVNTTLHYAFSYIGLGYINASKGTVLDASGSFVLIILSCIMFRDDRFELRKLIGCILGFCGVIAVSVNTLDDLFGNVTFMGDGMIILNALCGAAGGIITRLVSKRVPMFYATGLSMFVGGAVLIIAAAFTGLKNEWSISLNGILLLAALILISAVCFGLYNTLISRFPISKVAIFNSLIPVLGVFFSAIILGEEVTVKHFIAAILVAAGTVILNLNLTRNKAENKKK